MANLDPTHLDAQHLKKFVEEDIANFIDALTKIQKPDYSKTPPMMALKSLLDGVVPPDADQENPFLGIGIMATREDLYGTTLISKIKENTQSTEDIIKAQKKLFEEISDDLKETIKLLLKNQHETMASIDGEKFLDVFQDVDKGVAAPPPSSTGT